jgi:uncharacterized membrane protein
MPSESLISRIGKLVWVLAYGGLLTFVVSMFVRPHDSSLANWMATCGLGVAALGAVLVFVRAAMKNKLNPKDNP